MVEWASAPVVWADRKWLTSKWQATNSGEIDCGQLKTLFPFRYSIRKLCQHMWNKVFHVVQFAITFYLRFIWCLSERRIPADSWRQSCQKPWFQMSFSLISAWAPMEDAHHVHPEIKEFGPCAVEIKVFGRKHGKRVISRFWAKTHEEAYGTYASYWVEQSVNGV